MRNPERIAELIMLLEAIWLEQPDIRFNQLINNLQMEYAINKGSYFRNVWEREDMFGRVSFTPVRMTDLFYVEDEDFIEFLKEKRDELIK